MPEEEFVVQPQVADFMSEVLVLGVVLDNDEVALLNTDQKVPLGSRVL
jgi:tRNA-binding protein